MEGGPLEKTQTWAIAAVCFGLLVLTIILERICHLIAKWLKTKHIRALHEAIEKIKSELVLLAVLSLALTGGQKVISNICVPPSIGSFWDTCNSNEVTDLEFTGTNNCRQGLVPIISLDGIQKLDIFISLLGLSHVICCVLSLALGRAKMRSWNSWENDARSLKNHHDSERLRLLRHTSFGKRHLGSWTKSPFIIWIVCFFRQFFSPVAKVDYLTLRYGFVMAHMSRNSDKVFDFKKYIKRSLDEDFKVVVSISHLIWLSAVLFLLFNTYMLRRWLPFIPLIVRSFPPFLAAISMKL